MRGKVIASTLNVRSRPDGGGEILGRLSQDTIVQILGETSSWFEIPYLSGSGFVGADYVRPVMQPSTLRARVTAARLNVRNAPSRTAPVIGTLQESAVANLLGEHGDWVEIEFNNGNGFASSRYVDVIDGTSPRSAVVAVPLLNVRAGPSADSAVLGTLAGGTTIDLASKSGDWYETSFNGAPAYVSADHVSPRTLADAAPETNVTPMDEPGDLADLETLALAPERKFPAEQRNADAQQVALMWNKYGNLLQALSAHHGIDVGCAVAVLCVESAGKGFEQNNADRMIIRFENHKFWSFWGKRQAEKFSQHFRYSSAEPWKGHQWRSAATDPWEDFHGSQAAEWNVLEFARGLDDTAALKSISMGAPQIMGFNFASMGFASVQDMFEKFSKDIRYHIIGFFDFLAATKPMLGALKEHDFAGFATLYNGLGQAQKYGSWVKTRFEAFDALAA
jgi:uncharacterized protein YgiM (DUF1202 family)